MGYRIATSPNDLVSVGNALRDGVRGWLGEFAAPCSGLAHEQALDIYPDYPESRPDWRSGA
jgi:hypothetical protein